jgi:hypothetical protein
VVEPGVRKYGADVGTVVCVIEVVVCTVLVHIMSWVLSYWIVNTR